MAKNAVKAIPITTLDAAAFNNTFVAINPLGLPNTCFMIRIINDSNVAVDVAYDFQPQIQQVEFHDHLRDDSDIILYFETNGQPRSMIATMAKGTIVSIRGIKGIGTIYLAGYYVEQS